MLCGFSCHKNKNMMNKPNNQIHLSALSSFFFFFKLAKSS